MNERLSSPRLSGELADQARALCPELMTLQPSPLERWAAPAGWPIASLWVKRDDLLGEGGTKVRKLWVELSRARSRGEGVLTVGHLDSNHALATARFARTLGVPVELAILGAAARDPARAALLVDAAPTRFHASTFGLCCGLAGRLARARASGERLRFLPPGGTTVASTVAVALAVFELQGQFDALGLATPRRWAVAVGSGGTFAGLLAGRVALGHAPEDTVGMLASGSPFPRERIARLANRTLSALGSTRWLTNAQVELDRQTLGGGHGVASEESEAARRELGALGRVVDPIFTAKAAAGLARRVHPGEDWLLWHSGVTVA